MHKPVPVAGEVVDEQVVPEQEGEVEASGEVEAEGVRGRFVVRLPV